MPFTAKQEQAINDRHKDILVSASAGSGKTTVLVERVLRLILSGTSVDQLLIVTFTKAAAEEMKQRIKNELLKALNNHLGNRSYLRSQLNLVDTANISTIDAFCLDVIHRFYYAIDLDPSFSILTDETQAALLKERALKEIEAENLQQKNQDFIDFYDNFAGDRDADSARELLLDLYNYAMARPNYKTWLKDLAKPYQIADSVITIKLWQTEIKPYLLNAFSNIHEKIVHLLSQAAIETKELAKVKASFEKFDQLLKRFLDDLQNNQEFNQLREDLRSLTFNSFRKSSKWDEDLQESYQIAANLKTEAKDQVFANFAAFFASDEAEQIKVMHKAEKITAAISRAESDLIARFNQLKRDENLIDYSDMEQLAYQILSQDTSNSQLARDFYQNKFKEILVDEYQDINSLQEQIIQLIKKDQLNNLFMVGDVKQSIYGFRQAEPSLFLQKYHDFAQNNDRQERIVLADNFRSTKPVTKVVNKIFNSIMDQDFGGIDYHSEGQLVFGANYYPEQLAQASEILYHEKSDQDDQNYSEIQMVIDRIKQFKQENLQVYDSKLQALRPFKYSDIAILTRSRSDNLEIMQEFAKQDIPLFITDAQNYFQTFELTVIMNYLKIIDNPDQDIPLTTVLRSPIFNFKEKDLAKIRIHSQNSSFYNAVLNYVAVGDDLSKKVKEFLNQLTDLRDFASNHRISELIWSIYERTNLLEIMTALPNGQQRRINLENLYERANSYESAGFKGLYQFINFINRMRRSQKDLAQPLLTKEAGNAVRLMTIHGSKGLEFPIVFCLGLEHRFQNRDLNQNYVLSKDKLGLTIKEPKYRVDSLVKSISNIQKKRQLLEEESRILYVALTRAQQKLILVSEIENLAKKESQWQQQIDHSGKIFLSDRLSANSSLALVGPSLHFERQISYSMSEISSAIDQNEDLIYIKDAANFTAATTEKKQSERNEEYSLLNQAAKKLFDFKYPFIDASKTTAYQAVSEIKKAFNDPLDSELENSRLISSSNRYLQPIDTQPSFLFDTRFTGAEIGTATHLVLQFYDYCGKGDEQQLKDEIATLVAEDKLNPDLAQKIKLDNVNWFVHSDFAKEFWHHPEKLKREADFSSLILASRLFPDFSDPNAKILVHGTIDGYFVEDDGIILFDYKTDYVDQSHLDEAINNIKNKYRGQLRLYEQALNEIGSKNVKKKYLILLDAKKVVEVD